MLVSKEIKRDAVSLLSEKTEILSIIVQVNRSNLISQTQGNAVIMKTLDFKVQLIHKYCHSQYLHVSCMYLSINDAIDLTTCPSHIDNSLKIEPPINTMLYYSHICYCRFFPAFSQRPNTGFECVCSPLSDKKKKKKMQA
jgi:hypothetical protein